MAENTVTFDNGISICYEAFGRPEDPTILLIMGLGGPMGWWSTVFCENLAGRGFQVIRFDNRDTGRSSRFESSRRMRRTDLVGSFVGLAKRAEYTLDDMADDAFGLLSAIDVERAHVVGVSMGGMIAQMMAIKHPERVRSLASVMSTTGRRTVGWQDPRLLPMLFGRGMMDRDSYIARSAVTVAAIGSPGYPGDPEAGRRRAEETFDRGWSAEGVARHLLAVVSQTDRTEQLRRLDIPTVVIHGLADRMVHVSGGRATAAAIPNAELVLIPGMGHDLPPELDDTIGDAIERNIRRAERRVRA